MTNRELILTALLAVSLSVTITTARIRHLQNKHAQIEQIAPQPVRFKLTPCLSPEAPITDTLEYRPQHRLIYSL